MAFQQNLTTINDNSQITPVIKMHTIKVVNIRSLQQLPSTSQTFNEPEANGDNEDYRGGKDVVIKVENRENECSEYEEDDSVKDSQFIPECVYECSDSESEPVNDVSDSEEGLIAAEFNTNANAEESESGPVNGVSDSEEGLIAAEFNTNAIAEESPYNLNGEQSSSTGSLNVTMEVRPRKGRKRKYELTREEIRIRKYKNLPHVNSRNKLIESKDFIDYDCGCPLKCNDLISVQKRRSEFQKFYDFGSYNSQSMFIAACVKEKPVKRSYVSKKSKDKATRRQFSREYYLSGVRVCKNMFLKTLQTTSKRVDTSLKKIRSDEAITDKRGNHGGWNKIAEEDELFIVNHIKKMPTCRRENSDARFLMPEMKLRTIYDLYGEEVEKIPRRKVSFSKFKNIFFTKFDLKTKPLKRNVRNQNNNAFVMQEHHPASEI
ncbi:uncharacterized protein LOC143918786 [Arctopsyche grandis]|uniref:uncharacterized protein LOC143918786 n=1 Tax=Arctopsyche grandis TaxID=121162 RepID=UPI00406D63A6